MQFYKDQEVYFTAFLKGQKDVFYICKGTILNNQYKKDKQLYKVKVTGIALNAVGEKESTKQAILLGVIITKKANDLQIELPDFMQPIGWIEIRYLNAKKEK